GLARLLVAGHHCERRGDAAMRERDARVGRDRDRRAHTGDHLERNAGPRQRLGLFSAPPEDEWVAALEAHHPTPAPGVHDQERVDALLRQRMVAGFLTGEDAARARRLVEEARMHEPVVDDDVSATQELEAPHGHEPGIPGPSADQRDRSYGAHVSASRSSSSRSLAVSRPRSTMSRRTSGPSARRQASAVTARPDARSSRRASPASAASVAYSAVRYVSSSWRTTRERAGLAPPVATET